VRKVLAIALSLARVCGMSLDEEERLRSAEVERLLHLYDRG
jgi:hypothetical protein